MTQVILKIPIKNPNYSQKDTYMLENRRKPIAIHHREGSFSDHWIEICDRDAIPYKLVDCYDSDIVQQLSDCAGLMWHWSHTDVAAANFARQLTASLQAKDFPVFPGITTAWHFDDKLGQKYLFEALNIPHVPSFAFYEPSRALEFVRSHGLPLVFKLKGGAGSRNVRLLESYSEARRVIDKSLKRGWKNYDRTYPLKQALWSAKRDRTLRSFIGLAKGVLRIFVAPPVYRTPRLDSGYVYLQEFIPGNDSDVRIVVCGGKAFGFRRMVRDGDFRASGSGLVKSGKNDIPEECVKIAFETAEKLSLQSAAFDFVYRESEPLIVEVSYGFIAESYTNKCSGFWDSDLRWYAGPPDPAGFILESFLREVDNSNQTQA